MPQQPHLERCKKYLDRCRFHPEERRILAIGDSWLSLPGNLWPGKDVVQLLKDARWTASHGARPMNVLTFAHPSKELKHMARDIDLHQGLAFLQDLGDRRRIEYRFEAVIVTGGGNDILPFPDRYIGGPHGTGAILEGPLAAAMDDIRASWRDVIKLVAPWECPVIAHGYGPVTPTRKSGDIIIPFLGIGPWVGKYLLDELGLTVARGKELIGAVIDRLNATMEAIDGLTWFDARAVVDAIPPADWHDEIHFFEPGWKKLTERWLEAIDAAVGHAPVSAVAGARRAGRRRSAVDLTPQFKAMKPFTRDAVAEALERDKAAKSPAKPAPKKAAAKRAVAKKAASKKVAPKKAPAKKTPAKKVKPRR